MISPFTLFAATGYNFTLSATPNIGITESMLLTFVQGAKLETTFQLNESGSTKARNLTGKTVTAYFVKRYPIYEVLLTVPLVIQGDPTLGQVKLTATPSFSGRGALEIVEVLGSDKTKFFPELQFSGTPSQT